MAAVHQVAKSGFGAGTNALYNAARPSYQSAHLSHIRKALRTNPPYNIVEIGAGTGLFTRALFEHPEWAQSINQYRAIEPSPGMREEFSKQTQYDRLSVHEGTFDTTGIEDQWADVIVIAQALHWCPDFDAGAKEFSRILKPHGTLAMIWNLEDREKARWVARLRETIEEHENGTPQFRLGLWRRLYDSPNFTSSFEPADEKIWSYSLPATLDIAINRAHSKSYIAVLPAEQKKGVLDTVAQIVERGEDKVWIDESQGIFEYPYQTLVVTTHKT